MTATVNLIGTSGASPRKILMTADTLGGIFVYALELARGLAEHGVEVVLATMGAEPTPAQRAEAASVPGLVLETSAFALEWMEDPWDDVALAADWLRGLARAHRPDVVHLNGFAHGIVDLGAPKVVVGHSCVLSWWEAVHGTPPPAEWARYAGVVARGLRAADAIVAPSLVMAASLTKAYGPFRAHVPVRAVWNGLDLPGPEVAGWTGIRPDRSRWPIVLSAGRRWDAAKNLGLLDEAAKDVSWPVLVAGPDVAPRTSARAPTGLRSLGALSRPQLLRWLARASIYAHPARYEPFGLAPLEAARLGCALVLGDVPSLREVWGDAALYAGVDDADGLALAIELLVDRPQLRDSLAARARRRAERFTAARMTSAYLDVYRALLRRAREV